MRLGVDVDGVTLDTLPLYEKAFQVLGFPLKLDKSHLWSLAERHGSSEGIVNKVLSKVAARINVSLVPGAQILNKIVNLPHIESPIHFVSARDISSQPATAKALGKHFFTFPWELSCGIDNKGEYCDYYGLDFFVEDGPLHIEDIVWGSTTRVYILDKPYNREIDFKFRTLRVNNWSEILVDLTREGYNFG